MACQVRVSWIAAPLVPLAGYFCAVPNPYNCMWQPDTGLFNFLSFNPPSYELSF